MNNQGIRSSVLLYVQSNPNSRRAQIKEALNLNDAQVSNALAFSKLQGQLFCNGLGRMTTWTAVKPVEKERVADPLMAIFGR